jgi:hypothetical protein
VAREDRLTSTPPAGGRERDPAVRWLLSSDDPSVRFLTLTEVLGLSPHRGRAREAAKALLRGKRMRALLRGQRRDGGFGVHAYRKWSGAHWRLISMVALGIPAGEPRAVAAAETVLAWLGRANATRGHATEIAGRYRVCASMEGNAVGVCSRLGLAEDERVAALVDGLVRWQWPDGGWNCDKNPEATHSSFNESLVTAWGLAEYHAATGDDRAGDAAARAGELFLRHRVFRSDRTGEVIKPVWLDLRYPPYWHYGLLHGLRVLGGLGLLSDPRAAEALDLVEEKRLPDGRWKVEGRYWTPLRNAESNADIVDWGRSGPNELVTLEALRVLRQAGRW